jgi:hypothetical protein
LPRARLTTQSPAVDHDVEAAEQLDAQRGGRWHRSTLPRADIAAHQHLSLGSDPGPTPGVGPGSDPPFVPAAV